MEQNTVLPGDKITVDPSCSIIGPGLRVISDGKESSIKAMNCGILRQRIDEQSNGKDEGAVWINCDNRRYVPIMGDCVIGQVVQKLGAEGWKLEIGCAELANLSNLSFEGATKRNKPNVKLADLVYGRVIQTVEPEVVCISDDRRARSFGVLPNDGGWLIRSWPSHVRKLLTNECRLFALLGEKAPFEVTCGMNGWIWVKAKGLRQTMFVAKAVETSRHLDNEQMRDLVNRLEKEQLKSYS